MTKAQIVDAVREFRKMGAVRVSIGDVQVVFAEAQHVEEASPSSPKPVKEPVLPFNTGNQETDKAMAEHFEGVF